MCPACVSTGLLPEVPHVIEVGVVVHCVYNTIKLQYCVQYSQVTILCTIQ